MAKEGEKRKNNLTINSILYQQQQFRLFRLNCYKN